MSGSLVFSAQNHACFERVTLTLSQVSSLPEFNLTYSQVSSLQELTLTSDQVHSLQDMTLN